MCKPKQNLLNDTTGHIYTIGLIHINTGGGTEIQFTNNNKLSNISNSPSKPYVEWYRQAEPKECSWRNIGPLESQT